MIFSKFGVIFNKKWAFLFNRHFENQITSLYIRSSFLWDCTDQKARDRWNNQRCEKHYSKNWHAQVNFISAFWAETPLFWILEILLFRRQISLNYKISNYKISKIFLCVEKGWNVSLMRCGFNLICPFPKFESVSPNSERIKTHV